MSTLLTLFLALSLHACGGSESTTQPPVLLENTREEPPDAPEDSEVRGEPIVLLGVPLPAGTVAQARTPALAVEGRSSEVQWATSPLPPPRMVQELASSLGDSYSRDDRESIWRSSTENSSVEVEVFDRAAPEVQHLQSLPEGTRAVVKVSRGTTTPCDCENHPTVGCRCYP